MDGYLLKVNIMQFLSKSIKIKQLISFLVLLFINGIFAYKYFAKGIEHAFILSIIYILFLVILYVLSKKLNVQFFTSDVFYYSILFLYTVGYIILFYFIHVENLNVDRWSVISSFWEHAFKGLYPYNAQSKMGNYPGPLPIYFLLTLPFYLIGEIGYISLIGLVLFAIFIRKILSHKESIGVLWLLCLSVAIFWEIIVRSSIFVIAVLFFLFLFWLQKTDLNNKKQYWSSAIIAGLLLSTRSLIIFPLVIYWVVLFKNKEVSPWSLFCWMIIILGMLLITFLPFLIFNFHEFIIMNPFIIQSEHLLPFKISLILFPMSIIAGLMCSHKHELLYYSAGIFILIFIFYYSWTIHRYGLIFSYLKSGADISYMLFLFPFLMYFSFENKVRLSYPLV